MFVKSSANQQPIIDNVFSTVALCKQDIALNGNDNVINGTIGSLYDESGKLVAYDSFFNHYQQLTHQQYAAYAAGFAGNPDFNVAMKQWVVEDRINECIITPIATVGGSGAISITFSSMLDAGQSILLPQLAWESYTLMAQQNQFNIIEYQNFDGDHFNCSDLLTKAKQIMLEQHRLLVVINDPAHNPSGYSLTDSEWKTIMDGLNALSKDGPVCLLNDIAYIDYCFNQPNHKNYMHYFNQMASENMAVIIASSISKTATSYGLRLGCALIVTKNQQINDELSLSFRKYCRANWSNPNNSAMINFTWLVNHNQQAFLDEKQKAIDLLKQRATTFMQLAKQYHIETYPFTEGFFVTLKCTDNDKRDQLFDALVKKHVYICKVNYGLRIALCSITLPTIEKLVATIAETTVELNT